MNDWESDAELFRLVKTLLYTPVVGDILDVLGFTHQFLPQPVQPLLPEMKVAGRAMPVLMIDVIAARLKSARSRSSRGIWCSVTLTAW